MRSGIAATALSVVLASCAADDVSTPVSAAPATSTTATLRSAAATPVSAASSLEPATDSASSTPAPTESVDGGLAILASTVNGLRLRAGPGVSEEPLSYRCTGVYVEVPANCTDPITIDSGRTMVVFDGPVAADGFNWYLVVMPGTEPGADQLGWVATPDQGDAWLVPAELECPASAPDPVSLVTMGAAMAVHCHQGSELTLEGWVVTGFGCSGTGTFEPTWLAHPCANMSYIRSTPPPPMGDQPIFLHYPAPGVTNPTLTYEDDQRVRIVGHYDDPVASDCVIEPDAIEPTLGEGHLAASDPAADVAVCRMKFVVTDVSVLP